MALAMAGAALVALVGLLLLCAGKPKKEVEDTSLRQHRERSETIAMASNPLYRAKNSHTPVVATPLPAAGDKELDEDEIANTRSAATTHEVPPKNKY